MSSSRQHSNNPNNNNSTYQNPLSDYEAEESVNSQRHTRQPPYPMNNILVDGMGQPVFQQMYPSQDDVDEDLPSEIVAAFDARDKMQSNINEEDDSVFSDAVQDAFKKYQNEYSKYWTYDETTWNNNLSDDELFDDEQEELYAQMEECWNYMAEENNLVDVPKNRVEQSEQSHLNPDATEFKPTWLKSSSAGINGECFVTVASTPFEGQAKNL